MNRKFPLSKFYRIIVFGLKKFGAKIEGNTLYLNIGIFSEPIDVSSIKTIAYGYQGATLSYIIKLKNGEEYKFPYTFFDGKVLQELLQDLYEINQHIHFTNEVRNLLNNEIKDKMPLKFDFIVHKGEFFKRDKQLTQDYPSIDAFIGLSIVFGYCFIPFIFWVIGFEILKPQYSTEIPFYRQASFVLSGISLWTALMNLLISLVSMYLGHRLTYITSILFVVFMLIGLC